MTRHQPFVAGKNIKDLSQSQLELLVHQALPQIEHKGIIVFEGNVDAEKMFNFLDFAGRNDMIEQGMEYLQEKQRVDKPVSYPIPKPYQGGARIEILNHSPTPFGQYSLTVYTNNEDEVEVKRLTLQDVVSLRFKEKAR